MVVPLDRERLLAAVEGSPRAAAAHDRAGWVGLFTADGRIEDPVGSRPHRGHIEIGRFYDTFIGPRDIRFHRDLDIVFGTVVLRDLELEVAMGPAVTMYIPAILRYDLREANGQWRIGALRAYWELPAMMLQFLRNGSRAAAPAVRLSRNLLANQGLRGTVGFMAGFRRPGARHKRLAEVFVDAVARKDEPALRALSRTAPITLGDDDPLDIAELVEQLDGVRWTKIIGAGSAVAVSANSAHGRGIMFVDAPWPGNAIDRIRYFPA
ncbi:MULTISPECIES: ketosteroid isomerase family protein [unclassified Mycobacterium]|uniref:ketosteroid isomerase family protein n=1 Tax=unclassified Mycobacterium TaxID=2642494 RepID=UPI0007FD4075|nr:MULTISPECIES: ketosteroid isomerase family protein [unclassified Mycobacterium]OBH07850.1 transporter [Mycobacterium sp. E2699]OBI57012.1 transporter [Mycobacterium sp. E787]